VPETKKESGTIDEEFQILLRPTAGRLTVPPEEHGTRNMDDTLEHPALQCTCIDTTVQSESQRSRMHLR